jgi:hypothetical protein
MFDTLQFVVKVTGTQLRGMGFRELQDFKTSEFIIGNLQSAMIDNFPWIRLLVLLSIGAVAALSIFNALAVQNGILIAICFGSFFICWTWALFVYLAWRDRRNIGTPVTQMDREALKGTVYGLVQGAEYQVVQTFTDHYGNEFRRGEHLRFKERHFLPYHGGHTIVFDQRPLYLQEEANAPILENFSDYIARVD